MNRILIALALLSAVAACGYRLESGTARFRDPSVRMDVSPFANRSTTPDAGAVVAARLREELRRSGFRGSFGNVGADYLIEGTVREVRSDIFSHSADRFSLENRLTLVVDIRVVEVVRGGVLWKESGLSETASFFSGTDAQYTEANRRAAFEEVARRMAVRLSQTLRVLL
ncbi:MAG: LPS assembly lipoprotein LptE [Desulfobacteria bacterium]|nr:LPS assembly lipoprotein LptE [Thermodesulfobacteriota bacterium]